MNTKLRLPTGALECNPTDEQLRKLLTQSSASFWLQGSGALDLRASVEGKKATLLITRKEPFGFHLQYGMIDDTETWVAVSSTNYENLTELVLGGEPWRVPVAFFVSEAAALEAVLSFVRSGELPKNVEHLKWVLLNAQRW